MTTGTGRESHHTAGAGGAWERNTALTVTLDGMTEAVSYRVLLIAIALAESGDPATVAQRAIEVNALPDGFDVGIGAFGMEWPGHHVRLDAVELERAVWIARHLMGGEDRREVAEEAEAAS